MKDGVQFNRLDSCCLGRGGQARDKESRSHTKGQGQDKGQIHGGFGGKSSRQGLQVICRGEGRLKFWTGKTGIRAALITNVLGQGRTDNFGASVKHVQKGNHIVGRDTGIFGSHFRRRAGHNVVKQEFSRLTREGNVFHLPNIIGSVIVGIDKANGLLNHPVNFLLDFIIILVRFIQQSIQQGRVEGTELVVGKVGVVLHVGGHRLQLLLSLRQHGGGCCCRSWRIVLCRIRRCHEETLAFFAILSQITGVPAEIIENIENRTTSPTQSGCSEATTQPLDQSRT